MNKEEIDKAIAKYETRDVFKNDPVSYLWKFADKQDIEVVGFVCSYFCMGERRQIYKKCGEVVTMMGEHPYQWIKKREFAHFEADNSCMYRMFTKNDFCNLCDRMYRHYQKVDSLEDALLQMGGMYVETLIGLFNDINGIPKNTKSAVKRISLFLRWMVRQNSEVDLGIWKRLDASKLIIPLDVHVANKSRELGLTTRKSNDMKTAIEITERCKDYFPSDPTKMDFYLFAQSFEEAHPEQAEELKKEITEVELLTLATYQILYVNDLAINAINELGGLVSCRGKEDKRIYGALSRRIRKYNAEINNIIGSNMAFFSEFNLAMDELIEDKYKEYKESIYNVYQARQIEDANYLSYVEVARSMTEYAVLVNKKTVEGLLRITDKCLSLKHYRLTELQTICENFADWCYRKVEGFDLNKEGDCLQCFRELDKTLSSLENVQGCIDTANKFIGE